MNRKNLLSALLILFFIISSFAQKSDDNFKNFDQKDFNRYKIAENQYNFWWHKNDYIWFPKYDTIPYLVDDRGYRGLINYGLEFSLVERKNLAYLETLEMHKLKVEIENFRISLKDSIVEINGIVKGGWSNNTVWGYKKRKNDVDVFIGKKKDTIKVQYLNQLLNPKKITTTYKGEKINDHIALDTFPSYYIHSYKHFKTASANRKFKITSKIDKNTVLIFGLTNSYVEIYEIGELAFSNKINRREKRQNSIEEFVFPRVIIRNNIHQNDNYNINKEEKPDYYKITERAEDFILSKKYAKAKEEYNYFLKNDAYVFARDIHNAIRCAVKARDYKTAILWCEKLVLKGVDLTYFEGNVFNQLKTKLEWKGFLTKYNTLNEQFKNGLNQNLIEGINKLVEKDQKHYIKNSKGEMNSLDLAKITEEVDEEFINLIQKYGFPTEEKIGIRATENYSIFESPSYFVLLVHSYQTRSKWQKIIQKLFDQNKLYYDAYRSNFGVFKKSGMTCLQIYKGNLYNSKNCGANLAAVQKMKFKFNNTYNFIIDTGEYTIIPYNKNLEKEDEKFLNDNFNFIEKLTDDWFFYER